MNKRNGGSDALAVAVYIAAMRERIEKEQREKYEKRIDYLVGANNELARKLERCENGGGVEDEDEEEGVSIDFDFSGGSSADIAGHVVKVSKSGREKKRES